MDRKKDKEKKKNKTKGANSKDPEFEMKKGSSKGELFVVSGENGGEGKTDNAERNGESLVGLTSDNAERKRKRREKKDKKEKSEERVFVKESAKEGKEEKKKKKKQKVKKDDIKDIKVGEKDGEVSESCAANATEVRKERKKEKKRSKGESVVESKDTYNQNKFDEADLSSKQQENDVDDRPQSTKDDGSTKTNNEKKKKKKHKDKDDLFAAQQEDVDNGTDTVKETQNDEVEPTNKRKKKKKMKGQFGNGSNDDQVNEAEHNNKGKKRKSILVVNGSDNTSSPNKSNKKVRFSDQNEVFPPDLVIGKRFTPEEDEIVKDAVFKYIEEKDLGDEGVEMILNCGKHRALKGCWKEIASSIPYRPYLAIYCRARILLMRSESRKWTQEEYDMVKEHQEKHGNKWKPLADELGKHTWHVKDTWRRIKLPNTNKGHWSQEEYQRLFDLVNTDLQLKISEEKKSKHGMLRDNIGWTAISDELATRAQATCCRKWYKQLTSPMVAEGVWADSDDYRLLSALYSLDATCMEDVDWDDLIDNRSGEVCRKRWNQMVLHIGHYGNKSFAEQVEVLAERYCPHLLEAREIWDNKPRVP